MPYEARAGARTSNAEPAMQAFNRMGHFGACAPLTAVPSEPLLLLASMEGQSLTTPV